MVGIVSLHLPFRDAASRFSRRHTVRGAASHCHTRRRVHKTEKPPSAQGRGPTFSVTEDHDTAAFGVAAVMPSHPTVRCQRQRLSFIHRGPECPAIPPKELVFQRLFAERPFRWAKFTACRKKVCVFIGAVARSQGRLAQNPAKSQYARALPP